VLFEMKKKQAPEINQRKGKKQQPPPPTPKDLQLQPDMFQLIFDSIYNGCIVTNKEGYIIYFNKPYGLFLGIDSAAQIGKHCTDVIENTRMHIVARTGEPEINHTQRIMGQDMVVQRIPIKKNGEVIAVFGQVMFKDVRDVGRLAKKLSLLESKVQLYEQELIALRSTRYTIDSIVGKSSAIMSLKREALNAAANNLPVLISGESGTGKELFAQGIHHASPRKLYPFVRINCAAIPKDLLESELFGYEKGAFTGARSEGKPGKFELAHQGSMFLDEIGDLPLEMQPKLLRALEEKEFERVGGNTVIRADFRLITATNQNLEGKLRTGGFRKDLFYRLNVIPLYIPPLRERREDILPLTRHMLDQIAREASLSDIKMGPRAEKAFLAYDWPGNVRELSNVLERLLFSLKGDTIHLCDLPFYLCRSKGKQASARNPSLRHVQARAEREVIRYTLESCNYNKTDAAKKLGIHRTLLYKKMKKYDLPIERN